MEEKNPVDDMLTQTPLHTAADKGHLEICKIIIKKLKPKERNTKDIIGRTPQHFAAKNGFLAILKLMFDRYGNTGCGVFKRGVQN